jgi:putative ABC transport system permease protein
MLIGETILIALQSIRANLFRASLTMLGIIIGVAAVITMVALGTGARAAIDAQMEALGGDILSISASSWFSRGVARDQRTLTTGDAAALARESAYLDGVVPEISNRQQVKFGNRNLNVQVIGTTPNYPEVHRFDMALGRMFDVGDDSARRRVAVLASEVPTMLGSDPANVLGAKIQIRSINFEVIGVLEPKGSSGWRNPDDDIWIPLRTAQFRVAGDDHVENISARVRDGVSIEQAMVDIERILRREHGILPGADNDFSMYNRKQFLDTRQEATEVLTYLLAGIAGVSLVVGGIGIMNIMLVTVTERTREIGIRKALGATSGNILLQFLVEAMTLSLLGGMIGLGVGSGTSYLASEFAGWQTQINSTSVVTAITFSAAVGVVFGLWPARRAASLDPIDALRYE